MREAMDQKLDLSLLRVVRPLPGFLTLTGDCDIAETNQAGFLVKSLSPQVLPSAWQRRQVELRFRAFCALGLADIARLRCMPLTYCEVSGLPAFVMRRANGEQMSSAWPKILEMP